MINLLLKSLATLFVASVIALTLVTFALADGVDEPGFYDDLDKCTWSEAEYDYRACHKYDHLKIPFHHKSYKFVYVPYEYTVSKEPKPIPEPSALLMIGTGILAAWSRLK